MIMDDRVRDSFRNAGAKMRGVGSNMRGVGHAAAAGAAGVALMAGNLARTVKDRAGDVRPSTPNKGEGIMMKKSTLVALLVAVAAVAGVLIALYMYVLRRERELDEYEQLLFSEDFNDDLPDAFDDEDDAKD